ncbi:GrpB family protein, partial [Streptococcus pyogenes]|uniref:GrpB family protein n=1 Tax=Streptococcus pyogenes TaxID=1314 RepID=UPI003D9FD070
GLEVFRHTLTGIGFHEKPGNLRTLELCMMVHPQLEHFAIQLVARGSEFEHLFLGFRDALLENESLVREYNRVKMAASELDDASYRAAKEQFIHRVLAMPRVKRSGDEQARRAADRDPRAS